MRRCERALAFVAVVTAVLTLGVASSLHASDIEDLLTGYSLTSWNDGDGRRLGSVYALAQDHDGYLWIGSDAGLFRFDGSRFTPWDVIGDTPLPTAAVTALRVTRDGSLWAGFADGAGIRRILSGVVQSPLRGLEPSGSVTDLAEDHSGTIWAISEGALYQLKENVWLPITLPWPEREGRVLHLMIRRNGEIWAATRWAVFKRTDGASSFGTVVKGYIWDLSEDANGVVWATDIAAGFRELGAGQPPRHSFEGAGFRLMHDHHGDLWVATFGEGLWRVHGAADSKATTIERAALRTGLSSDSVQSVIEDRDGNIWVGTTGGLHRLTRRKLTPVENGGFVVAVAPGENGQVWAGTTKGVVRFSTTTLAWERRRAGTPEPDVRVLHRDRTGQLWVGATDGVWRWVDDRLLKIPMRLPGSTQVLSLASDPTGALWVGDGDWLYRWDGTRLNPLALPRDKTHTRVTFATPDRAGRLWLGFTGGALAIVERDGSVHPPGSDEGADCRAHGTVHAVFEDHEGTIWIGGTGGLSRFADGRCQTLSSANGLPADRVWAIVEDTHGQLWLNVDRGILRLARHDVLKALSARNYRVPYRLYDASDGVAGAPVGIIGAERASNGTLLFVRGGGLTLLNPRELSEEHIEPPPLRVETIVANERRLNPAPGATLPPGTRRLQINYTALTLTGANAIRFRYRLDGFDTAWIDAGTRRTAFYTNLSPRAYRFRVEASTEDGGWMASETAWGFSIRPSFSQTNWFYGLCAVVLGLIVWGAWQFRLRIVRRQFTLVLAERARLSREMHDTLLQSLVGVALQFDAISRNIGPASAAARDQLVRVRRQVETYIKEARQSIWELRSPFLDALDLGSALRELGVNAVAERNIEFDVTVSGSPFPCSSHIETQLLRIGQEAITNAVRHSSARHIRLELVYDKPALTLRVTDDGLGFEPELVSHGSARHFGLTAMRERAEQIAARFTVATTPGQGTMIEAALTQVAVSELSQDPR